MIAPVDENRLGLPSGSGLERIALCPGSWAAEKDLPEETSEDAAEGILLHDAVGQADEGRTLEKLGLTSEQEWAVTHALELWRDLCVTVGVAGASVWERRLYLYDPDTLEPIFSARLDVYRLQGTSAIVGDFKFGRGDVEDAQTNMQLRSAAAILAEAEPELTDIFVAIIQPRAEAGARMTYAHYEAQHLALARNGVRIVIEEAARTDAERRPGLKQCRYCKAKGTDRCPESWQETTALATLPETALDEPAKLAAQLDLCVRVEDVIDAVRARARKLLVESPDALKAGGWILEPGTNRREVTDAQKAFLAVQDMVSPDAFVQACSVKISVLDGAFQKAMKKADGTLARDATTELNRRLTEAECMKVKSSAPSLKRIKTEAHAS